ncbi:uncharacterized protein N7515_009110 [Penicillium bovifimosum]|uniref:Uncharacterized protein n=1 Tax=Penicillium bovifimosum TaxID=126998 RepID=A0A9W9KVD0_9EURO|nr:uncharacterized protein N7515_009110 [Penicillium bovifimosum]KAJ5121149.1 hypothetical protein N7515_009110 [Penicillium bovifimosum]
MRYRNWDVLLFPGGSKVPIQEFKTQCFVTKDRDSPFLRNPTYLGPHPRQPELMPFNQLPTLTTFVPGLQRDSPFQVSIHSWEKPRPSSTIESNMEPEDVLLFEARIFLDGTFVAGSIYGQRTKWPQIIDHGCSIDRDGNPDSLRFPPFHPEILQQRHWDAGDSFGRIKVVIAEGFSRPNRSPPFERFRHVIAFSFQHAPLDILEYSNIAWPNPKMWLAAPNAPRYGTANKYVVSKGIEDGAHGHSPTKPGRPEPLIPFTADSSSQSSSNIATYSGTSSIYDAWTPHRGFPIPSTQWNGYPQGPRWDPQDMYIADHGIEALVDDTAWRHRGARSSREDVPMPDYASTGSTSSRALSGTTGFSYEHSKQPSIASCLGDEQYNELIQALTPTKASPGTRAPLNTPSTEPGAMGPPKSSAAAAARIASYKSRTRHGSVLKEISQPSTRAVSGSSEPRGGTPSQMRASPNENVRGRKERDASQDTPKAKSKENSIVKENDKINVEIAYESTRDETESIL